MAASVEDAPKLARWLPARSALASANRSSTALRGGVPITCISRRRAQMQVAGLQ